MPSFWVFAPGTCSALDGPNLKPQEFATCSGWVLLATITNSELISFATPWSRPTRSSVPPPGFALSAIRRMTFRPPSNSTYPFWPLPPGSIASKPSSSTAQPTASPAVRSCYEDHRRGHAPAGGCVAVRTEPSRAADSCRRSSHQREAKGGQTVETRPEESPPGVQRGHEAKEKRSASPCA